MKIRQDAKRCHGCRACELMCSFHHKRFFSPESSSIHVLRDNSTGVVYWSIDATCDECKMEEIPFCERYCLYGALKKVV